MATKTYVLDTSVLIHDPHSIKTFEDCQVVIPLTVLGELDNLKAGTSQAAHAAREASRIIDTIRDAGHKLTEFAPLSGTTVRVCIMNYSKGVELPTEIDLNVKDNQIIATAITARDLFNRLNPEEPQEVVLVSKDTVLRLVAESVGMKAEDYKKDKVSSSYVFGDVSVPVHIIEEEHAELLEKGVLVNRRFEDVKDHALIRLEGALPKGAVVVKQSHGKRGEKTHQLKLLTKKDLAPYDLKPRNAEQLYALYLLMEPSIRVVTISGLAGSGKAQPLDVMIPTPLGWRRMGDIKIGDKVFTRTGETTDVIAVHPQGMKEVYRVTFSDETNTLCCKEHLWETRTSFERDTGRNGQVRNTADIEQQLTVRDGRLNHSIPMADPVKYPMVELPIDPYVLGVLIGDGSISAGMPSFTSADQEIVEEVQKRLLPIGCDVHKVNDLNKYGYNIIGNQGTGVPRSSFIRTDTYGNTTTYKEIREVCSDGFEFTQVYKSCKTGKPYADCTWQRIPPTNISTHPVKNALIEIGLWGKRSYEKTIPQNYMTASVEQRRDLLQGLMDTDGTVGKGGSSITFSTSSKDLSHNMRELVNSLGGTCIIREKIPHFTHKGVRKTGRLAYICHIVLPNEIQPFKLRRKMDRVRMRSKYPPRRYITKIELVDMLPCQCITVADSSHLYLTESYIVTHNSILTLAAGLEQVQHSGKYKRMVVIRPTVSIGEELGYLPGTLDDKMAPWMKPIYDNVETLLGGEDPTSEGKDGSPTESKAEHLFASKVIEVAALSFLRGRTISNALIYIDEAQNISPRNLKSCITRAGSHSKVVIAGDIDQIDTSSLDKYSCGLAYVAEKFKDQAIAAHAILRKSERSSIAEMAATLL